MPPGRIGGRCGVGLPCATRSPMRSCGSKSSTEIAARASEPRRRRHGELEIRRAGPRSRRRRRPRTRPRPTPTRIHARDAQPEPARELERAGVRAVHREQLLQVRLGAIRIARRDDLGELEQLDLGLLLACLRDEDVLQALVRLDVLGIEREHAAQVIDGLLVEAVLHVDVGLGEDLRDLLGVALGGRRRAPRIRRRLHVGREVGVVVLRQREVDARQALLVDERQRAGHLRRRRNRRQVARDRELRVAARGADLLRQRRLLARIARRIRARRRRCGAGTAAGFDADERSAS